MNAVAFSALAEPNRLRIVELLRQGPTPVGEIAERLVLKQPLVSSHLKVLSRAGLVSARPVAQKRLYELEAAPFGEIAAWTATFDALWTERLDRFETQLDGLRTSRAEPRTPTTTERGTG